MKFEWDPSKAASNARKHGVTFEQAKQAFVDPHALELFDDAVGEERWRLLGRSQAGVLVVVYAERGRNIRIISARLADKREREAYHDQE
jgi:uncharacterized DUF497 family protein